MASTRRSILWGLLLAPFAPLLSRLRGEPVFDAADVVYDSIGYQEIDECFVYEMYIPGEPNHLWYWGRATDGGWEKFENGQWVPDDSITWGCDGRLTIQASEEDEWTEYDFDIEPYVPTYKGIPLEYIDQLDQVVRYP